MNNYFIILFILASLFTGCETKEYASQDNPTQVLNSNSDLNPTETFDGITSVSSVSDISATLNWTDASGIGTYKVYDVTGGGFTLLENVTAPASSHVLTGLESNTSYTIQVLAQTTEGRLVYNDASVSFTTNALPATPTLIRNIPSLNQGTGANNQPTFHIYNLKAGDTVKLYSDGCVTEVASHEIKSSDLDPTFGYLTLQAAEKISTPGIYTFAAKTTNPNGVSSVCANATTTYTYQKCPLGYATVPADPIIGNSEFCVMEYEAKAWKDNSSDGIISSLTEVDIDGCDDLTVCTAGDWGLDDGYKPGTGNFGQPWRNVSAAYAKTACKSLGDNYDLISNQEWMAIARNIEEQAANWPSGTVGVGCLNRGNIGISDQCSYKNASSPIESNAGSATATFELSNGDKLYHFSGNVFEWIDMGKDDELTLAPISCEQTWSIIENASSFCSGLLSANEYLSDNPGSLTFDFYENVYDITVDSNSHLFIATDSGLAKSTDSATSFSVMSTLNGLSKNDVSGGVGVNSSGHIFVASSLGVDVSTDGGLTFSRRTTANGLGSNNVNDIFVDASDNIYVATNSGLSISTNGGTSFTNYDNATNSLANDTVLSVYVDGTNIYAGTTQGLSLSTDGGTSFTSKTTDHGLPGNRIESLFASGTNVYVGTNLGFSFSTDSMGNFTNKNISDGLGSLYVWDIFVSGTSIYLGTEVGLAISTNSGTSFSNFTTTQGLANNTVYSVYVDSSSHIYAATESGLSISSDSGNSFVTRTSSGGLGGKTSVGLGQIFGGTGGAAYRSGSYLFGEYSGIYMLNFSSFNHQTFQDGGFRCVFRPD